MDNERKIPKNAFDSEYATEFLREVRFLSSKGIRYTFVHKTSEYGISRYKYTKTPALFAALIEFYSMIEAERNLRKKPTPEEIKKAQEVLERAEIIKPLTEETVTVEHEITLVQDDTE